MELEGVQGRTLFPTLQQGPWWPIARFAESTVEPSAAARDPHPHEQEEAVNYLLDGELTYAGEAGESLRLGEGAVALLTAVRPHTHDLYPTGLRRTRWLSLVVALSPGTAEPAHVLRRADASPLEAVAAGVERRNLVGPRAPIQATSELEVVEVRLAPGASTELEVGAGRRLVAYVHDGAGTVRGLPAAWGSGVLAESLRRLELASSSGMRVTVATVPSP